MLLFILTGLYGYKLKLKNTEQYIGLAIGTQRDMTLVPKNFANEFLSKSASGGEDTILIEVLGSLKKILDIAQDLNQDKSLIIFAEHGGSNQVFKFEKSGHHLLIKQEGLCLEYMPDTQKFLLKPCSDTNYQKFELEDDRGYQNEEFNDSSAYC